MDVTLLELPRQMKRASTWQYLHNRSNRADYCKHDYNDDEVVVAELDLSLCNNYRETLFDFDRYRRPETYSRITNQSGVTLPEEP